ncbi:MAG: acylphosphatase [Bacteroidota bacterium]|nr:acylphosphatase [Bacteroidota bacterium]
MNAKITVKGIVQGVGYRWFADRTARKYDVKGFVENLPEGSVFLEVEGEKGLIEDLIKDLRVGPRSAVVDDVIVEWGTPHYLFLGFKIKA